MEVVVGDVIIFFLQACPCTTCQQPVPAPSPCTTCYNPAPAVQKSYNTYNVKHAFTLLENTEFKSRPLALQCAICSQFHSLPHRLVRLVVLNSHTTTRTAMEGRRDSSSSLRPPTLLSTEHQHSYICIQYGCSYLRQRFAT